MNPVHPNLKERLLCLLNPVYSVSAVMALKGKNHPAAIENLCDWLMACGDDSGVAAVYALAGRTEPMVIEALGSALRKPSGPLRLEATRALSQCRDPRLVKKFSQRLQEDVVPLVRRVALSGLFHLGAFSEMKVALTDPVWRVRRSVAGFLFLWGQNHSEGSRILNQWEYSENKNKNYRAAGVFRFLKSHLGAILYDVDKMGSPELVEQLSEFKWWNYDPAVLKKNLKSLNWEENFKSGAEILSLVEFQDSYPARISLEDIRELVLTDIMERGTMADWRVALDLLSKPRIPDVVEWVIAALKQMSPKKRNQLRSMVLEDFGSHEVLCWALNTLATEDPVQDFSTSASLLNRRWCDLVEHPNGRVRKAAVRACARLATRISEPPLQQFLQEVIEGSEESLVVEALRGIKSGPGDKKFPSEIIFKQSGGKLQSAWLQFMARLGMLGERSEFFIHGSDSPDYRVRMSCARGLGQSSEQHGSVLTDCLKNLQNDSDRRVRAAAMTPERADYILSHIDEEHSCLVISEAARILGRPLVQTKDIPLFSSVLKPGATVTRVSYFPRISIENDFSMLKNFGESQLVSSAGVRDNPAAVEGVKRPLGTTGLEASVVGISGRYGLNEAGFYKALESGVNLIFWEPSYRGCTRFLKKLATSVKKSELVIVGGTFECEPRAIRRDLEQMLKLLKIDRVDLFMMFWVRSPERMGEPVLETLINARKSGLIRAFGLSSHRRPLIRQGIEDGWDVVMVRHNAAYRGAEREVFPLAMQYGTGVLTFNNLCYQQLLKPPIESEKTFSATDCYRYSLSQPGVSACISGPRTLKNLKENLEALKNPILDKQIQTEMQEGFRNVRAKDRIFRSLIQAR